MPSRNAHHATDRERRFLRDVRRLSASVVRVSMGGFRIPAFVGEFWTPRQRQASSLHEISYRACFKAHLPAFFISRLTETGDVVYDPFSGRGTTTLEAGLSGRRVIANDINPLSALLSSPRFFLPTLSELEERLARVPMDRSARADRDLSMFFHQETAAELVSLRRYLRRRLQNGTEDHLDRWIRMVATNRLTGHSSGFFSVYTLPPNQAVQPHRQKLINQRLGQRPEYRNVREIILRKSRSLLRSVAPKEVRVLRKMGTSGRFLTSDARKTPAIRSSSVHLTVTSPPFLNIVDYAGDNWLRCWFNALDADAISSGISACRTPEEWSAVMGPVLCELFRITAHRGWVAFEVGEVKNRKINLEDYVVPLGVTAGFVPVALLLNTQRFTKTSNIWGVRNNRRGTNTNRIVLFRKD